MDEIKLIKLELVKMSNIFNQVIKMVPSFKITDPKVLPYGLKPHTRSVSWIVEQVIAQQTKYNKEKLRLSSVKIDLPDTCLHDLEIIMGKKVFYINIKITQSNKRNNKNDIAAVEKLYMQYNTNPDYRLIYVIFGFIFDNLTVIFDDKIAHTFSPQFLPIYVNPRNDKIQAYYSSDPQFRTRQEFMDLLKVKSTSIIL